MVHNALAMDLVTGPVDTTPLPPLAPSLLNLVLEGKMTEPDALQLLESLSTPHACSTLEQLAFDLGFRPSAEFLPCLTRVLDLCGPALKQCRWAAEGEVIPQLTANTSLQNVEIKMYRVTPRLRTIRRLFDAMLSNITSAQLEWLDIEISLGDIPDPSHATIEKMFEGAYSAPEAVSAFHAILCRGIFDGILAGDYRKVEHDEGFSADSRHSGVQITLEFYSTIKDVLHDVASAFMSAIKHHVITLFAPWLDRGVLRLVFIPPTFITSRPMPGMITSRSMSPAPSVVTCTSETAPTEFNLDRWTTEPTGLQLLQLLSTAPHPTCTTLGYLAFDLGFRPSTEFLLCLNRVLGLCGPALRHFSWAAEGEAIPQLTANSSLQDVRITLYGNTPRLRTIRKMFDAVLSNITSAQLEWLDIAIHLDDIPEPSYATIKKTFKEAYTAPEAVSTFHCILSRSVFDGLTAAGSGEPGVQITLFFDAYEDYSQTLSVKSAFMSAIETYVIALFAPWLDRAVLRLQFNTRDLDWDGTDTIPVHVPVTSTSSFKTPTSETTTQHADALVSEDEPAEAEPWGLGGGIEPELAVDMGQGWAESDDEVGCKP
ncbi:hypothetical protein EVJ58_g7666 [Rhodofomes roseus]|uniref:Uncharacterized protein n=1 Tax=Rhodofomes roseus TaxID=34475 RepID=A0A4Y9Y4A0_9APHY|nr:hypothetical protein EVJ58_g7666 [Rhodofomes roseus]